MSASLQNPNAMGALRLPPATPDDQREFSWTPGDFTRVQALIYKRAGIRLHDGKHAMVYSRLSRRLRDTGHQSFKEYLTWLESTDGDEWQEFVPDRDEYEAHDDR